MSERAREQERDGNKKKQREGASSILCPQKGSPAFSCSLEAKREVFRSPHRRREREKERGVVINLVNKKSYSVFLKLVLFCFRFFIEFDVAKSFTKNRVFETKGKEKKGRSELSLSLWNETERMKKKAKQRWGNQENEIKNSKQKNNSGEERRRHLLRRPRLLPVLRRRRRQQPQRRADPRREGRQGRGGQRRRRSRRRRSSWSSGRRRSCLRQPPPPAEQLPDRGEQRREVVR